MPNFSANLGYLWTDLGLPEAILAAKNAGFAAVECHHPYETAPKLVREALQTCQLEMLSLNTGFGPNGRADFGLSSLPGRETEARELIDQALDYAVSIDCRNVHVLAGRSGGGKDAEMTFHENLTYACEIASKHDISILIEPINSRDVPDYHLCNVEVAVETIEKVGHSNLKVMFDCYHVQIMQGDLTERIRKCLPFIGHIQIAGVPDRNEPDKGEVNYKNLCESLDSLGYNGYIGAEYQPSKPMTESLNWLDYFAVRKFN